MKNLLSKGNTKLKKSGIASFGIPAYKAKNGRLTCPMAGQCAKGCYAQSGTYTWSNVAQAFEYRYEATFQDNFVSRIDSEIKRSRSIKMVRIHDSGDFYSLEYIKKWLEIIRLNPGIKFYVYTKMVKIFKNLANSGEIPENFTLIYSYGGKQDHLIDPERDRHSAVFASQDDLLQAGYADASHDDTVASGENPKIGLVYHGAKSKTWTAGGSQDKTKAKAS